VSHILQYSVIIGLFSILLSSGISAGVSALPEQVPNTARFITLTTNSNILDVYESKGCSVKYIFEEMSAIDCPPAIGRLMGLQLDIQVFAVDIVANDQVKATAAQASGLNGTGVTVAVLDTGVDSTHPDLLSSVSSGKSFVSGITSFNDDNGHGTFVSGLITSDGLGDNPSLGSAPDAEIWAGKVLDSNGSGYLSDIVAAINYIADPANNLDVDVISMSLGTGPPYTYKGKNCDRVYPAMTNAIKNAIAKDITVIAAAGNSGNSGVGLPGCITNVITVGAIDFANSPAWFSSEGRSVDVVALGVSDYSTVATIAGGGYDYGSGTSFSTPIVAGVIALIIQDDSTLSPKQIQEALRNTAVDIGGDGFDRKTGYGLVDAVAAINYGTAPDDSGESGLKCNKGMQKRELC